MSIDAMYWVWNHSQSKGTARHVMVACANWITGPDCTVRASTAELVQFSNAARSSVIKAVDALVKSGELQMIEEARGTRPALYKIPGAVGYSRPERGARGPKIGPLADSQRSGNETPSSTQGSGNETPTENARGPKTGPQGSENETPRGPETGPHYQHHGPVDEEEPHLARERDSHTDALKIAQPLINEMTQRGMRVSWQMQAGDWKQLVELIHTRSVPVLVDHAERVWQSARTAPYSARYFLPGWRGLPETPVGATPRLRAVAGGYRPYEDPTDQSVYDQEL
ncbi:hypothetical protein ACIRU8_39120 [Streptomyces sp. NPDC101175]|uniref:hypothetical protein n=1 Tax=Streptomyces sp. NPDC101175 TaxID=3366123 RepID=UPI0038373E68